MQTEGGSALLLPHLAEKKEILLPTIRGKHRTSFTDIQYVEAFDRGTRFVLANETVECRLKFNEVEALIPKSSFLLCHRAYMVNLSCIKYIRPYEFSLKSGETVPIAMLQSVRSLLITLQINTEEIPHKSCSGVPQIPYPAGHYNAP